MDDYSQKQKSIKLSNYALVFAITINIVDILSWFIMRQSLGPILFIALRGLPVLIMFFITLCLSISGLKNQKTRTISIITIILDIIALWPFFIYSYNWLKWSFV
ncbi:hypothetical protein IJI55_02850 [Candidatus Saccharibacteria bacterium]|nr:hypothetical protein [Candidatus Saccharibacteria bacterium]